MADIKSQKIPLNGRRRSISSGTCLNLFWNGLHLAIEEIISLLLPLRLLMKGLKTAPLPNYRPRMLAAASSEIEVISWASKKIINNDSPFISLSNFFRTSRCSYRWVPCSPKIKCERLLPRRQLANNLPHISFFYNIVDK